MLEIIIEVCSVTSQSLLPYSKPKFSYILIACPFLVLYWWNESSFFRLPYNEPEVAVQVRPSNPAQLFLQVVCVLLELMKDKSEESRHHESKVR
jgi:hypothetical protein